MLSHSSSRLVFTGQLHYINYFFLPAVDGPDTGLLCWLYNNIMLAVIVLYGLCIHDVSCS